MKSFLLSYLLNALWQIPFVFAAAWLAARSLRRLGPAVEHRIWCCALIVETILPACYVDMRPFAVSLANLWLQHTRSGHGATVTVTTTEFYVPGAPQIPTIVPYLILMAYAGTLVYFTGRLLWGLRKTVALRHHATAAPETPAIANIWHRCAQRFAVRNAHLATSSDIPGPVTIGIRHRLLLLPTGWLETLRREDLDAAIAHEFAHMYRRDFAKNLVYEVLSLPVAWHPALWLTRSRLAESRELLCDAIAAEAVAGKQQYARSLVRLASEFAHRTQRPVTHAIGIFDANNFERRIMNLTQTTLELRGLKRFATIAVCLVLGFGACASAMALHIQVDPPAAPALPPVLPAPAAAVAPAIPPAPAVAPVPAIAPASPSARAAQPAQAPELAEAIAPAMPAPPSIAASAEAPQPADDTMPVSGGVMAGNILTKVAPVYPDDARAAHISGTVVLHAIIGKDGVIEKLVVVSGPKELQRAALDAVRQWVYKPYLLNGNPTEVDTTIKVNFSLNN